MRYRNVIALLAALATVPPVLAGAKLDKMKAKITDEAAQAELTVEAPLAKGQPLVVENLIGSLTLEGNGPDGKVVIEARVVADADTIEAARELAKSVTLKRADAGGAIVFRTGLPVDRNPTIKFPRSDAEGPFAKWIAPLVKRGKVAYPWDGTTVTVGNDRGATAMAVHLHVQVPMNAVVTLRQIVGGIRTARTRGTIVLENVDGGVISEQTYGSLDARSTGGEVLIRTFRGDALAIHTGGRDVEVVDVHAKTMKLGTGNGWVRGRLIEAGDLVVESAEGAIQLDGAEAKSFKVVTGTGSVDVTSLLKGASRGELRSASGDVTLRVPEISRFEIDARSGKGSISAKGLSGLETLSSEKTTARYRYRGGGAAVRLESEKGGVTIAKAK